MMLYSILLYFIPSLLIVVTLLTGVVCTKHYIEDVIKK